MKTRENYPSQPIGRSNRGIQRAAGRIEHPETDRSEMVLLHEKLNLVRRGCGVFGMQLQNRASNCGPVARTFGSDRQHGLLRCLRLPRLVRLTQRGKDLFAHMGEVPHEKMDTCAASFAQESR